MIGLVATNDEHHHLSTNKPIQNLKQRSIILKSPT